MSSTDIYLTLRKIKVLRGEPTARIDWPQHDRILVMVTSAEHGIAAGARWVHNLAADHDRVRLLSILDCLIEAEASDHRMVYASIRPILAADGQKGSANASQEQSAGTHWWLNRAGTHWPDDEEERANFVRGFLIGSALEIRDLLMR
jgi:hypothetical protein